MEVESEGGGGLTMSPRRNLQASTLHVERSVNGIKASTCNLTMLFLRLSLREIFVPFFFKVNPFYFI